jgi:hypothetical protein
MSGRLLMALGSLFRLGVGAGYLTRPDTMSRNRIAPDIRDNPAGRMSLRGFGGLHVSIALATLYGAACDTGARQLVALNIGCALADTTTTLLEWRERDERDAVVLGSLALDAVDTAWWTTALRQIS